MTTTSGMPGFSKAARIIIIAAALVIVIAGMREAASLLVPFLLSVFIAVLCLPAMQGLKKRKVFLRGWQSFW